MALAAVPAELLPGSPAEDASTGLAQSKLSLVRPAFFWVVWALALTNGSVLFDERSMLGLEVKTPESCPAPGLGDLSLFARFSWLRFRVT